MRRWTLPPFEADQTALKVCSQSAATPASKRKLKEAQAAAAAEGGGGGAEGAAEGDKAKKKRGRPNPTVDPLQQRREREMKAAQPVETAVRPVGRRRPVGWPAPSEGAGRSLPPQSAA